MGLVWLLCAAVVAPAAAPGAAVYAASFDEGPGTWQVVGQEGTLRAQREMAVKGQALEYRYTLSATRLAAFGTAAAPALEGARAIRFQIRCAHPTVLFLNLAESDGSNYGTLLSLKPGAWVPIELSLQRLSLTDDSRDENGRLDLGQVRGVGFADATALVRPAATGDRTLWLDEYSLNTAEAATAYSPDGKLPYRLDDFETSACCWLAAQGELDQADGRLLWRYEGGPTEPGVFTAILADLGALPATGATHLLLTLVADRATKLVVVLQEEARDGRDESRYLALVDLERGLGLETLALDLKDFELDTSNDGRDENGRLDLDQVKALVLGDLEAIMGDQPGPNLVELEEIELVGE